MTHISKSTAAEGQWMGDDTLPAAPAPTEQAVIAPQPIIGKLLDEMSQLQMLWGLNEPGALVRFSDVSNVLFAASKGVRQAPTVAPKLNLCEHMWELQPASANVRMTEKCRFCYEVREIAVAQEKAQ